MIDVINRLQWMSAFTSSKLHVSMHCPPNVPCPKVIVWCFLIFRQNMNQSEAVPVPVTMPACCKEG